MKESKLNLNRLYQNYYLKAFLMGAGVAFLFFIPFIVLDKGYFLYYGDYNVQDLPFYRLVHDAIRNGEFFWSYKTDLGANLIGSYTFYMIGSPFFWLTLPFSSNTVPYLMGPLFIIKYGFICLSGYIYLKRYVVNKDLAMLGALLYTFSGFSLYNIFFFHFHEALITFPLMLSALDSYMYERKRGVFALTVLLSAIVNYYFFAGQAVFLIIYWLVRMIFKSWTISVRDFVLLLCEALVGVMMSCVLMVPSFLSVIQNPRTDDPPIGWKTLLYDSEQRYVHILQSFFFPPDIPARPNFTPDSNAKWASLGAWLPLFSMSGVIAFMQSRKKHWLKGLLAALFVTCFIPVLNSSFQLFNMTYYARWFYMLTLMMSLATILSLNSSKSDFKRAIKITTIITLCIAIPIAFMPTKKGSKIKIGLMTYPDRFWIYVAIAILSILILLIIMDHFKKRSGLLEALTVATMLISVFCSMFVISLGKSQSYDTHNFIIPYSLNGGEDINLPDKENCRIDIYNGMDNQAMFWEIPTIQAFHTIVPGSIMEFYPSIGVTRDVGSRAETDVYGLRALTSCKWLFDYPFDNHNFVNSKNETAMPGWSYYDYQNGFNIYKNDYFIPYGFTYDSYVTVSQFENVEMKNRNLLMLKAIVLDDQQAEKYSDILTKIKSPSTLDYSQDAYFNDCKMRNSLVCDDFSYKKNAFAATIDLTDKDDQLVFFSVPYEDGWKASVNSEPVKIEKVNIGFMAVRVPGGQKNTIEFTYMTPGLILGLYITIAGMILFIIYFIFAKFLLKNNIISKKVKYKPADQGDMDTLSRCKRSKT